MIPSDNTQERANNRVLMKRNISDKTYAFLSGTIYDELIDHGVDQEYIFSLSLYFHICIMEEFFDSEGVYNLAIFETISDHCGIQFNDSNNNVANALYKENFAFFRSIYDDINNSKASSELSWLMDWKNLCRHAFESDKEKAMVCVAMFKAVNESLDLPEEGVMAPPTIIKLVQMIYQEIRLVSEVEEYIKKKSLLDLKESPDKQLETNLLRPTIATTEAEMSRLLTAWESSGIEHKVVADRIANADKAVTLGLVFPVEGGQHVQWYQCESCEAPLSAIDSHHHQCPSCKNVYSGFPYDNVLYDQVHRRNISSGEDAAWAWTITGETKYADFAASTLLGYADRYLKYPMLHTKVNDQRIDVAAEKHGKYKSAGRLHAQTLTEANSLILAAITYDLIYDTLSEGQKRHIEKNFISAMAENINFHKAGKSNWQTWHNAALLYAGAVTGEGSMIRQALLDEENGFIAQMRTSVTPEGMWHENSWGYHYYSLSAMTHIAEGTRRLGFDLYKFPSLRKMYYVAFDYLMGDGSLPRFGDTVQDSPLGHPINEIAYASYGDKLFLTGVPPEPNWDSIALGRKTKKKEIGLNPESGVMPGTGHSVLATNGPGKLTVAFVFGLRGTRSHLDKLSFVMFGYGQELAVDPGRSTSQAYRLPIHREWYSATAAHNTVLVDGNSQREANGDCLAFNSTSTHSAVTAVVRDAYENVSHTRFMLLAPNYLLVIDELKSVDEMEHTYDWLYHNKGLETKSPLSATNLALEKTPTGYGYLRDIKSYKCGKGQPVGIKFVGKETSVHMTMVGEEKDRVFTATGPHKSIEDRVPMVIVRRKGATVRFATVLEPVPSTGKQTVKSINLVQDPYLKAVVVHDKGEDQVSFGEGKLDRFTVQNKSGQELEIILENWVKTK